MQTLNARNILSIIWKRDPINENLTAEYSNEPLQHVGSPQHRHSCFKLSLYTEPVRFGLSYFRDTSLDVGLT